jgi:hypothetical protein
MEAVVRELVGRDIVPEIARCGTVGQQVPDEALELLMGLCDVLALVQEGGEFGSVVFMPPSGKERVCLQDGFEALAGAARLFADFGEMCEVLGDLAFVPCGQDRFDWSGTASPISPSARPGLATAVAWTNDPTPSDDSQR